MTDASWSQPATAREPEFGDYVELLKPRVMRLVVFTAFVGLVCAPVPVHPVIGARRDRLHRGRRRRRRARSTCGGTATSTR